MVLAACARTMALSLRPASRRATTLLGRGLARSDASLPAWVGRRLASTTRLSAFSCSPMAVAVPFTRPSSASAGPASAAVGPRVVIVGGGFGGLYTALRLDALTGWPDGAKPRVTLVDREPTFLFKPLMYELLTGEVEPWEVAPPFRELLAPTGVAFVQAAVAAVTEHPAAASWPSANAPGTGGRVTLRPVGGGATGEGQPTVESLTLEYDFLVMALGSTPRLDLAQGAREWALPFNTLGDANAAKARLESLRRRTAGGPPGRIVVVGGGASGVELACTCASVLGRHGRVELIAPGSDVMRGATPEERRAARAALSTRGVRLTLGSRVERLERAGGGGDEAGAAHPLGADAPPPPPVRVFVRSEEVGNTGDLGGSGGAPSCGNAESSHVVDAVFWTVGQAPATAAGGDADGNDGSTSTGAWPWPFPRGARGGLEAGPTLQVPGHPRVFALGDSVDAVGGAAAGAATAQVALQQADFAAWNILCAARGRRPLPFRYQHLGSMMTFGGGEGALAVGLGLSAVLRGTPVVDGPLAALARRAAYWYRMPTTEHRVKVGAAWLQKGALGVLEQALGGRGARK